MCKLHRQKGESVIFFDHWEPTINSGWPNGAGASADIRGVGRIIGQPITHLLNRLGGTRKESDMPRSMRSRRSDCSLVSAIAMPLF